MANLNGTVVKTATCKINYNKAENTIVVTSPKGGTVVIDTRLLKETEAELYSLLCDENFDEYEEDREISWSYMAILKNLNGQRKANPKPSPRKNKPEKTAEEMVSEGKFIDLDNSPSAKAKTAGSENQDERIANRLIKDSDSLTTRQSNLDKMRGKTLYIFNYYIPVELSTTQPILDENGQETGEKIPIRIPNPARMLWRHGAGLDGSNWILTEEELASEEVQAFCANVEQYADFIGGEGRGPETWACPQDPKATTMLVDRAQARINQEVQRIGRALLRNIFSADERLKKSQELFDKRILEKKNIPTEKEILAAEDKRNNEIRGDLKKAADELCAAFRSAEIFESTGDLHSLFFGMAEIIKAQEVAFNRLVEEMGNQRKKNIKPSSVTLPVPV